VPRQLPGESATKYSIPLRWEARWGDSCAYERGGKKFNRAMHCGIWRFDSCASISCAPPIHCNFAAAIFAGENHPASLDFVCLDKRLSLAAQREGFNVITA
jgi:hypothetical protein